MEFSRPPGAAFEAPRRVFTAPVHSSAPRPAPSSRSVDGLVDTLYDHPSVKIVSFTAGPRSTSLGPRTSLSALDIEPGSLSWSSQMERTIAVGPFRIYRAPGSVAFLSCGSALQPILPKSQAWCVDENSSKFVLQIRRPQYWRIEIPVGDAEDRHRAQHLRELFDKILQFEKTECPFKRTFTVELPELPQTPAKKRPWTPVRKSCSSLPATPITPLEMAHFQANVSKEKLPVQGCVIFGPETNPVEVLKSPEEGKTLSDGIEVGGLVAEMRQDDNASPRGTDEAESLVLVKSPKLESFRPTRSVTAPPFTLLASPPSKLRIKKEDLAEPPVEASRSQSPTGSQDSFHSLQSFPPSPPISDPGSPVNSSCPPENIVVPKEDVSLDQPDTPDTPDLTVISEPSRKWSLSSNASNPSDSHTSVTAPSSTQDLKCLSPRSTTIPEEEEVDHPTTPITEDGTFVSKLSSPSLSRSSSVATRRPQIRHRATTSSSISPSRRALSPLPPAANLFTPRPQPHAIANVNKLAVIRQLPMAVIHKTFEILMSPPSHLVNLMLKVAARIAAGEWRGFLSGTDERGDWIPVQWDWSDDEDNGSGRRTSADDGANHDEWLRTKGRKMAGTFPESDDEDNLSDPGQLSPTGIEFYDAYPAEDQFNDAAAEGWGVD